MPDQKLESLRPADALRAAVKVALDTRAPSPLIEAAGLLIGACRRAAASEPDWAEFLSRVDDDMLKLVANSRVVGPRIRLLKRSS